MTKLGYKQGQDGNLHVGQGRVISRNVSPRELPVSAEMVARYLSLVDSALLKTAEPGIQPKPDGLSGPDSVSKPDGLVKPGYFCLRRGPFVVIHAETEPVFVPGELVDVFDPSLTVKNGVRLQPGTSGLYRDVSDILGDSAAEPCVLHATHRLISQNYSKGILRLVIRGPAETPAVVHIFPAGKSRIAVRAHDSKGNKVSPSLYEDGVTNKLQFSNDPDGVTVEIVFGRDREQWATIGG